MYLCLSLHTCVRLRLDPRRRQQMPEAGGTGGCELLSADVGTELGASGRAVISPVSVFALFCFQP